MEEPDSSLLRAVRASAGARSLEAALAGLVGCLDGRFRQLTRVSMRALAPDGRSLVIVGVWSIGETNLGPGGMMSILSSSYPEMVAAGRTILAHQTDDPVLTDILRTEGVRSWVSVPLRRRERIVAMLSISSWASEAFSEEDLPLLDDLGAALQERLLELAERSGHLPP